MSEFKPVVVWILGAGFSKSLGGPLIDGLLAPRDLKVLRSLFPSKQYPGTAEEQFKARLFCQHGKREGYWDHAEQFLDLIETAEVEASEAALAPPESRPVSSYGRSQLTLMLKDTVRHPETQILEQGGGLDRDRYQKEVPGPAHNFETLGELAAACRRALAIDTSIFLRSAQPDTERWSPYTSWATKLPPTHGVVTFNYDHVPELLAAYPGSKLRVLLPTKGPLKRQLQQAAENEKVPVLKVHGSVTWRRDQSLIPLHDPDLLDPRVDRLIGVPGPQKRALIQDGLQAFWRTMLDWLIDAHQINFVGYRFPPTDADSRGDLLDAIRSGASPPGKWVQTVLGPKVESDDSLRLQHLLRSAGVSQIRPAAMLAEDYLAMFPHGP